MTSLSTATVKDVIGDSVQSPIHVASINDTIKDVLQKLTQYNIQSVPVIDGEHNFLGIISILDLLDFLVRVASAAKQSRVTPVSINLKDDDLDMLLERSSEWKLTSVHQAFGADPLTKVVQTRQPFLPVTEGVPLSEVLKIFERGIHRVPVVKKEEPTLVTYILTQSALNKFIASKPALLGDRGSLNLIDLGLIKGIDAVVSVPQDLPAIDAFTLLTDKSLTSVGIVNDRGALVGVLSATDLKLIKDFKFKQLLLPVLEFVKKIRSEQQQLKSYTVWVKPTATLAEVVQKMAEQTVHRVYVVNDENRPISVVSISDVSKTLSKLTN